MTTAATSNSPEDKILCVDDAENMLHLFKRTLGRIYKVHTASSGAEALEVIRQHGPFMVIISDYNMPEMNGLALLQQVKAIAPDTVQILLTGAADLDIAIAAVNEVNIFRYLPKPCPIEVLRKVTSDALDQYHLVDSKRRLTLELEIKNQLLAYDLEMAKTVYNRVLAHGQSYLKGLDSHIASLESVGGDLILTHFDSQRILYLLLGDLTGHGLAAALAALLVSDVFTAQCLNKCSLNELVKQINQKMCRTLPTGLFCAAVLAKLDFENQQLEIWQGGLPIVYLLDKQGRLIESLPAENLALGVIADPSIPPVIKNYPFARFNSLFACSDGVTEQIDSNQQMFGSDRLQATLQSVPADTKRIAHLVKALDTFRQSSPQFDDISMFDLDLEQLNSSIGEPTDNDRAI